MQIVYDTQTMQGIKLFKDRKSAERLVLKLNLGAGYLRYDAAYDQLFYQRQRERLDKIAANQY